MALTKCSNCGKEISDKAYKCLHCDFVVDVNYVTEMEENIVKQKITQENNVREWDYKKIGTGSMIAGCIAWAIGFIDVFTIRDLTIFVGMVGIGGSLMISGPLVLIYDRLKEKD